MRTIPLTQGEKALVDDCDYDFLSQWNWYYHKSGHRGTGGYAVRKGPQQEMVYMSSIVANRLGITGRVDHKDQNKLNNQRFNLRPATNSQNGANRRRPRNNTTGFKGVGPGGYPAQIKVNGRTYQLGRFDTPERAAQAYNKAARKYFGDYACLNPV